MDKRISINIKTISGYLLILAVSFLLHTVKPSSHMFYTLLPVLMLIIPIISGYRVRIALSLKDIGIGFLVSVIILLPYYLMFGGDGKTLTWSYVLMQLLIISFPEEFFFRGFLQDSIGRNYQAVVFVSLFFALAHLPNAFFEGEWISLLSFFPSLVMGWLYMKTNNIIPGAIFHLLANLVYQR